VTLCHAVEVRALRLNQMYSLRYGTIPIVRTTGGLDDTVIDASKTRYGRMESNSPRILRLRWRKRSAKRW